jgi:hypothetical protein
MMKAYTMSKVWKECRDSAILLGIFSAREQAVEAAIKEIEEQVNNDRNYAPFNRELVTVVDDREIFPSTKQGWYWEDVWYRVDEYEVQGGEG